MRRSYTISLIGHSITVSSDADEGHVQKVVDLVRSRAAETSRFLGSGASDVTVALLTALNVADEYLSFMGAKNQMEGNVEARTKRLLSLMESVQ